MVRRKAVSIETLEITVFFFLVAEMPTVSASVLCVITQRSSRCQADVHTFQTPGLQNLFLNQSDLKN